MKNILMTLAVLLMAGAAMAQEKLLQWDQLMDRNLYPQREMMSFIFAPDGKTVTYFKGSELYGFDGKKEFKLTEAQQDWRKPKDNNPRLEERVEPSTTSTLPAKSSKRITSPKKNNTPCPTKPKKH